MHMFMLPAGADALKTKSGSEAPEPENRKLDFLHVQAPWPALEVCSTATQAKATELRIPSAEPLVGEVMSLDYTSQALGLSSRGWKRHAWLPACP